MYKQNIIIFFPMSHIFFSNKIYNIIEIIFAVIDAVWKYTCVPFINNKCYDMKNDNIVILQ